MKTETGWHKENSMGAEWLSIYLLKEVMGHSDIKVSLTYLRGLDVPTIREEDMPMLLNSNKNVN